MYFENDGMESSGMMIGEGNKCCIDRYIVCCCWRSRCFLLLLYLQALFAAVNNQCEGVGARTYTHRERLQE